MIPNISAGSSRDVILKRAIYYFLVVTLAGMTFSIAVSSIAMGLAIGLWLIYLAVNGRSGFSRTPLDMFFICYCIAELLATVFSVEPLSSVINMKRLFLISIMYMTLLSIDDDFKLKFLLGLLVAVTTMLTIIELFSLTSIGGHFVRMSLFQYYLTEAGIKMFVLLLLLPFVMHAGTPPAWKVAAGIAGAILLVGLVITQTRSAWLGFIGGAVTLGIIRNKKFLLALLLVIILFLLFAPSDYKVRAASMFDPSQTSNLSRIHMITTGWRMFLDRPLLGLGDVDLKRYYILYTVPIDQAEGGHLHNNFMTLLVTLGFVGFAATMALFVKVFQIELLLARQTKDHWLYGSLTAGCFAAYVSFHINGLFEWNFGDHEIALLLWFTVGVALLSRRRMYQLIEQPIA